MIGSSSVTAVAAVLCYFCFVAAGQLSPFASTNGSVMPFPSTLDCNPPNQSASSNSSSGWISALDLPGPMLSWCQYQNAYILSDFLSRNSSDLTTDANDMTTDYELRIQCGGVEVLPQDDAFRINLSDASTLHRSCQSLSAIQAGSAGVINMNGTIRSLTNYINFADLSGQLLFVYFNNNTMARNIKVDVTDINNFDVTSVQSIAWDNRTEAIYFANGTLDRVEHISEQVIVQDLVMFVTNGSMAAMLSVGGLDQSASEPCVLFSYDAEIIEEYDVQLIGASFFPQRPNSTNDLINAAWVAISNLSKTNIGQPGWGAWMNDIYYYQFNAVPATQADVNAYLIECLSVTPMGVQLWTQFYSWKPLQFEVLHNRASNMSLLVAFTDTGVTLWRIGYFGTYEIIGFNKTLYEFNVFGLSDWCTERTYFNPLLNRTVTTGREPNTIFCAPAGATIDSIELATPDLWTDIGLYNKDIWVIIAMHNATSSFVHIMSLTELISLDQHSPNSTFENPLGVPVPNPCDFDTQVYSLQDPNNSSSYVCQGRVTQDIILPVKGVIRDISAKVILGNRQITTTGNRTDDADIGSSTVSQDHCLIFIAQGSSVLVYAMYSRLTSSPAGQQYFGLTIEPYNDVKFQGNVTNLYVSDNGMHLLTAVSRQAWELASQTRYNEICNELLKNPDDPFLKPAFGEACAAQPGQSVNLNTFTQYASYCTYGYCPSLDQLEVSLPPSQYYADRPAVMKICPPGYFCIGGQKMECPQGFYCDESGMAQPKRCPEPVNSNSTCARSGLLAPDPCPYGTVCTLAHIPGLPAPPGFEVPTIPSPLSSAVDRSQFVRCAEGSWCVLGGQEAIENSSVYTNTTFQCPANTYCGTSAVIEPVICECTATNASSPLSITTANGSTLVCGGRTLYCPAGSEDVSLCPAGSYCTAPNVSAPCSATQYCAPGTFAPILCPAGTYCPDPSQSIVCPGGHYCPEGTTFPIQCNFMTVCPQGSAAQTRSLLVVVVIVGVVAFVFVGFFLFTMYEKRKQEQDAAAHAISREVHAFLSRGGEDDDEEDAAVPEDGAVGISPASSAVKSSRTRRYTKTTREAVNTEEASHPQPPTQQRKDDDVDASLREPILNRSSDAAPSQAIYDDQLPKISIPTSRFQTPSIAFDGMGLCLQVGPAKGKMVLDNVTGVIPPGSFVAVMGPSGSGKSTFMHTLAGKAFYGNRTGRVLINGDEVDLNQFSKMVGFVKQDDIMLREMTVAETLLFNARMRYDPLSLESPEAIANVMLTVLDLNHVRNTNIGDEKTRGVSGGQRKRVNIGMELVALPSILFLDEPTSGLDSSSSMTVCGALREMADVGITVIAVIHQPRYEIFNMFHKVMLLAKGGKLVYYGAPQDALAYFESYIGIPCPPHVNPPDFFLDVISGEVNDKGLSIDDMVAKWQEYSAKQSATATDMDVLSNSKHDHVVSGLELAKQASQIEMAGFFSQLRFFFLRSVVQLSRDLLWFFTDLFLVFVAGFFLGLVFSQSDYQPPLPQQIVNRSLSAFGNAAPPLLSEFFARPIDDPIISEASLTCMAIGMTGITAALRVFGNEQIVYWREASAGMSTTAYFLAKNMSHIFFILLSPLLYLAPFLTFVSARAGFMAYYRVLVLLQFSTTGLGYLISITVPGGLAQLAGVVVVLVFSMFGGSRPTLVEIQKMFILLQAMPYASYIRWAQEALYIEEITVWGQVVNIQPSLDLFDYHLDDYQLCMLMTFVFGVIFRILALLAMSVLHRDQKH